MIETARLDRSPAELDSAFVMRTSAGEIGFILTPATGPTAVDQFRARIQRREYDASPIHRLVANFCIQGGCPNGDGTSQGSDTFTGERSPRPYKRGDVCLASTGPENGNGSQFFICLADLPDLPPLYPLVGHIVSNDRLLDELNSWPVNEDARPQPAIRIFGIDPVARSASA